MNYLTNRREQMTKLFCPSSIEDKKTATNMDRPDLRSGWR